MIELIAKIRIAFGRRRQNMRDSLLSNKTTKQTFFKNSFWLLVDQFSNKIIMFFLVIVLARYLGIQAFGEFNFSRTFAELFIVLADFGIAKLTIRELSRTLKNKKGYVSNAIIIKAGLALLSTCLVLIIVSFLNKNAVILQGIILFNFVVIFNAFNEFFFSIYKANEKMELVAKFNFFKTLAIFILVLIAVFLKLSIPFIILGWLIPSFFTTILNYVKIKRKFYEIKLDVNKKTSLYIIKESWPLAFGMIFTTIYVKIDTVMLSFIQNDYQVGLYSSAYKIVLALQGILFVIHHSLLPRMSNLYFKNDFKKYKLLISKTIKISFLLLFPLFIVLSLFSKLILTIAYGQEFSQAYLALIILLWNVFIIYFSVFWGNSLQVAGRQKRWMYAVGVGAFVNIILNIVLIKAYGYLGAAVATILTEILVFVIMYLWNDSRIKFNPLKNDIQ